MGRVSSSGQGTPRESRTLRIDRRRLAEIVAEEVRARLRELVEGPKRGDDDDEEGGGAPDVASADQEDPPSADVPSSPGATVGSPDPARDSPEGGQQGAEDDTSGAAVDGNQPDPDALDKDGDSGEDGSGAVNDDLSGKTVQGISINPKSEILPGAKEVVLTFNETTDQLVILFMGPSDQIKFFWKNQLHDLP